MIIAVLGRSIDPQGRTCSLGSGKDTAADVIEARHFAKVALADPIKRFCAEVYGFSRHQLWGPSHYRNQADQRYARAHHVFTGGTKCACCGALYEHSLTAPCYLTPRYALQQLGTEWGRACWADTWLSLGLDAAEMLLAARYELFYLPWVGVATRAKYAGAPAHATEGVVFSDIRFFNEVKGIRAQGGKVVLIERPVEQLPQGADLSHLSEQEAAVLNYGDFDAVVINDGSLEEFTVKVEDMLLQLRTTADTERPPPAIQAAVDEAVVGEVASCETHADPVDELADVVKLEENGISPTECTVVSHDGGLRSNALIKQEAIGVILDSRIIPEDNPLYRMVKAREASVDAGHIRPVAWGVDEDDIPPFMRGKKELKG